MIGQGLHALSEDIVKADFIMVLKMELDKYWKGGRLKNLV